MDNAGVSEPVAVSQRLKGAGRGHSSRAGGSLLYVVFFMERVRARGCPPTLVSVYIERVRARVCLPTLCFLYMERVRGALLHVVFL